MDIKQNTLYCSIRKELVAALPEEIIRQRLLVYMLNDRGFPEALVAVEKTLKQMPHLGSLNPLKIPHRRADIICYGKGIHPDCALYPLLLIECKAVKLTSRVINQVAGYNQFVKAYFIAIVNDHEIQTGWFDPKQGVYVFVPHLPSYEELLEAVIPAHNT
ncbi:MAG: type I restriction enzyme HsdR N-terminal domain-containing protein [Parachlamydiaceae bacterium]|nr:type I restriction enzyme HsdR N-terminal domain-containing protein [Parachlamydiaceae bacterium]